jgi:hypothetical protein
MVEHSTKKYDAQADDALAPGPQPHLGRAHFFREMRSPRLLALARTIAASSAS